MKGKINPYRLEYDVNDRGPIKNKSFRGMLGMELFVNRLMAREIKHDYFLVGFFEHFKDNYWGWREYLKTNKDAAHPVFYVCKGRDAVLHLMTSELSPVDKMQYKQFVVRNYSDRHRSWRRADDIRNACGFGAYYVSMPERCPVHEFSNNQLQTL